MARLAPHALVAALAASATLVATHASAQTLPRVHVEAISLRPDRASVAVRMPFHVRLHVHIREPGIDVAAMVILPDITGAQIVADERHTSSVSAGGSDFTEDLALVADRPGIVTLSNAHVDAIDPQKNKAFRYAAGAARVVVVGPSVAERVAEANRALLARIGWSLGVAAAVALAILLLARQKFARRMRRPKPVPVVPPLVTKPVATEPVVTARDRVLRAAAAVRRTRARGDAVEVRTQLFALAGVASGRTLRDALAHTSDVALRRALIAAERAAFASDADLPAGIDAVVIAVDELAHSA